MADTIYYEQPLNERIRLLLRVEHLLGRIEYHLGRDGRWDSHCALNVLLEMSTVAARGDLKSELIKELERQQGVLYNFKRKERVDTERLDVALAEHENIIKALHAGPQQLGLELKDNELVNGLRQRSAIPGGLCDFDLPAYHFWLSRPEELRKEHLSRWATPFLDLRVGIDTALGLIRSAGSLREKEAASGLYQQTLDSHLPFQMVRVALDPEQSHFPQFSADKHRFNIRFIETSGDQAHGRPIDQTVTFRLACCAI